MPEARERTRLGAGRRAGARGEDRPVDVAVAQPAREEQVAVEPPLGDPVEGILLRRGRLVDLEQSGRGEVQVGRGQSRVLSHDQVMLERHRAEQRGEFRQGAGSSLHAWMVTVRPSAPGTFGTTSAVSFEPVKHA